MRKRKADVAALARPGKSSCRIPVNWGVDHPSHARPSRFGSTAMRLAGPRHTGVHNQSANSRNRCSGSLNFVSRRSLHLAGQHKLCTRRTVHTSAPLTAARAPRSPTRMAALGEDLVDEIGQGHLPLEQSDDEVRLTAWLGAACFLRGMVLRPVQPGARCQAASNVPS